jgi:hypothetical protein
MKRTYASIAALFLIGAAHAQNAGTVTNHALPVGRGPGMSGFGSLVPGASGLPLVSNGAASDPSYRTVGNSAFANAPANTFKCNPTGVTAAVQDCTVITAPIFPAMTGDVTTPGGSLVTTLASTGVPPGSYGNATVIPAFSVDAKGRITGVTGFTATPAVGSITGLGTGVATALGTASNTSGGLITSPAAVANGGTGRTALTSNAFITGAGTSAVNQVALTGLVLGNGASAPTAYAGTSCTNQFPRSLNANGAATCNTVSLTTDVTGILPVANGGTGNSGGAWTSYSVTPVCGTATFTTVVSSYQQIGKTVNVQFEFQLNAIGSCTNSFTVNLPVASGAGGSINGAEYQAAGLPFACAWAGSGVATVTCRQSNFPSSIAAGAKWSASGVYQAQ